MVIFMIPGTPPTFPHEDSAEGVPSPGSGLQEDLAGDGEEQSLHGVGRRQRTVEPPRVAAHDCADA